MNRIAKVVCCLLFLSLNAANAQDVSTTIDQTIADIFEQWSEESEEIPDYQTFYEELQFLAENPINLNQTSREELSKMLFLSDIQVENILAYLYQYGPMENIYELQLVDGLDMTDIRRMLPFVAVKKGKTTPEKIYRYDVLNYGKNELYLMFNRDVETRQGYRMNVSSAEDSISGRKNYLGSPWYHSAKYRFHFKDRILAGLTCEKDAGESFFGSAHKGYDFYSGYLQMNRFGIFKTIVLGDFRANFGQGLVMKSDFSMGKSSYVLNVVSRNEGLKKSSSTDEYNYFRGGGATIQLTENWETSFFYSNKMIDADTAGGFFSSIYKTGYHRTENELIKKHTIRQQVAGGNISWRLLWLQTGFTFVHTIFDRALVPEKTTYNHFYFSGKNQNTAGWNYRIHWQKMNFFGEAAVTNNFHPAFLNGFTLSPISLVNLVAVYRYYSPDYDTFYASALSETSRINNESGLYVGAEINPVKKWKISSYADSYRFQWPKYGIDAPSVGKDYLFQTDFAASRRLSMYWRFRHSNKPTNILQDSSIMPVIEIVKKNSLRYQLSYSYENFSFKTVAEGNMVQKGGKAGYTYGLTAYQDLTYAFAFLPLKIDFRYQFFDAVAYENRLYAYEKDVLYAFSIPMYYGAGSRYYLNLKYELNRQFSLWFKIAQTVYADDREEIGSGKEKIFGNKITDVKFLLRCNF